MQVMLIRSLQTKGGGGGGGGGSREAGSRGKKKRVACGVFDTFATHADLIHDVTGHKMPSLTLVFEFAAFKQDQKLIE